MQVELLPTREEELERIMDEHGDSLLRMCCLYLKDIHLAEDAVQETFLKAYRSMDSFRGDSAEKTWLTRIAINTCMDVKRTPWQRFIDRHKPPEDIPGGTFEQQMGDDTVSRAVMALPQKYRLAVLLHYYEGLPVKDIAQVLSLPVSTVTTHLSRGRERLRDTLKGWYFDDE